MHQQEKFKFPRTFHFPDSEGVGMRRQNLPRLKEMLWRKPVEITWKMDGENTTLAQMVVYTPVPLTPESLEP